MLDISKVKDLGERKSVIIILISLMLFSPGLATILLFSRDLFMDLSFIKLFELAIPTTVLLSVWHLLWSIPYAALHKEKRSEVEVNPERGLIGIYFSLFNVNLLTSVLLFASYVLSLSFKTFFVALCTLNFLIALLLCGVMWSFVVSGIENT